MVDVGGGIGSTSMLLASAFSSAEGGLGLKFVIQDRPVVVEMGEKVCEYSSSVYPRLKYVDSLKGLEGKKSGVSRFWDGGISRSVLLFAPFSFVMIFISSNQFATSSLPSPFEMLRFFFALSSMIGRMILREEFFST